MLSRAHENAEKQFPGERVAFGSGIVFAALQIIAILFAAVVVVPTHAPVGAPPAETAAALGGHANLIAVGTYLFMLPTPFLLIFLGGLFVILQRAEGGGALAPAALAAGVAAVVIASLGTLLSGLSAPIAQLGGDPAVVTELDSITPLAMALAAFPHAVLLFAASTAGLRSGLIPSWLARAGLALVPIALISTATIAVRALFPLTALVMLLFPLWILALSVALFRRSQPAG